MMKKTIKIVILIVAVIGSLVAIMWFYKTKVSPPQNIDYSNSHFEDAELSIAQFSNLNNNSSIDSLVYVVKEKVDLYNYENYITSNDRDILMEDFAKNYLPVFVELSISKFNHSKWDATDHKWMKKNISDIKALKIKNDSELLVQGAYLDSLDRVLEVINQYNAAKKIAKKTSYNGVSNTKKTLTSAQNYAEMEYLRNCTDLVKDLNALQGKIENSHLAYIRGQVEELAGYRQYESEDDYNALVDVVAKKISDYKDNAISLYEGMSMTIGKIEQDASNYYQQAVVYFESIRTIVVYNPSYTKSSYSNCSIYKVEISDESTIVYCRYYGPAKEYYISENTYIEYNNKKYNLTIPKGILTIRTSYSTDKISKEFTLSFPPINKQASTINLVDPYGWKFTSIKLR